MKNGSLIDFHFFYMRLNIYIVDILLSLFHVHTKANANVSHLAFALLCLLLLIDLEQKRQSLSHYFDFFRNVLVRKLPDNIYSFHSPAFSLQKFNINLTIASAHSACVQLVPACSSLPAPFLPVRNGCLTLA